MVEVQRKFTLTLYGANGELVYMQLPRTAEMNTAFNNFLGFINAWLCNPVCDSNDLQWDDNNDTQINFVDYASNTDNFELAFHTNGRYVFTDFKNSVIGVTDVNDSVIVISYNAWGQPSYTGDIDGLSILWNGYYYDDETGNYYLRNRYYSPLERRFITDDPRGINPDGNWNNWFNILSQYSDGYGLMVYATGDPVNNSDPWGTRKCKWVLASSSKKMYTICILMTR